MPVFDPTLPAISDGLPMPAARRLHTVPVDRGTAPSNSPEAYVPLAFDLCVLRGVDPYAYPGYTSPNVPNWALAAKELRDLATAHWILGLGT